MLVNGAELSPVPVRLLEVVGQDLLVLQDPIADHTLEPASEGLMEGCPAFFWDSVVGGIADKAMNEPKYLLLGEIGPG
jgi:hypothetical protein